MAVVCKEPTHLEARSDLSLLGWFVRLLDKMVRDDGCDLERLRDGIARFEKVATDAVDVAMAAAMPVNPALWPLSLASGRTGKVGSTATGLPSANVLTCDADNCELAKMRLVPSHVPGSELHGEYAKPRHGEREGTGENPGSAMGEERLRRIRSRFVDASNLWIHVRLRRVLVNTTRRAGST